MLLCVAMEHLKGVAGACTEYDIEDAAEFQLTLGATAQPCYYTRSQCELRSVVATTPRTSTDKYAEDNPDDEEDRSA